MNRQHDELVVKAVRYLKARFFQHIRADVEGLESPHPVEDPELGGGFVPDISAGDLRAPKHFVEVEVPSTLHDEESARRWEFFSKLAAKRGGHFRVAVSSEDSHEALNRLEEVDPTIKILEL